MAHHVTAAAMHMPARKISARLSYREAIRRKPDRRHNMRSIRFRAFYFAASLGIGARRDEVGG